MAKHTDQEIIDTFVNLTEAAGKPVSISDLVKALSCSRKTLYNRGFREEVITQKAVVNQLAVLNSMVPEPGGDLYQDLLGLARDFYDHYRRSQFLMIVIPQILSSPGLHESVKRRQKETEQRLLGLFNHYRKSKGWCDWFLDSDPERSVDHLSPVFLGGIFSHVLFRRMGIISDRELDLEIYVDSFLAGYGSEPNRKRLAAKELIGSLCREAGVSPDEIR